MSVTEKIKKQSTVTMLIASLFAGLIAAGLGVLYLKNREAVLRKQFEKKPETMLSVVVPVRDLLPGEIITKETVSARSIPEKYVDPGAITTDKFKEAEGRRVQYPAQRGKPILFMTLSGINAGDFSDSVVNGRRAVTIKVDRINSFDGMLRPGNHVDILLGVAAKIVGASVTAGNESEEVIFPVLENVTISATGQQDARMMKGGKSGAVLTDKDYSSVTVDLFPEQVAMLKAAEQSGRLIATLRNKNDISSSGYDTVRASQLLQLMKKARNAELARASTQVVRDANGNVIGKIVGDTAYDAQGNVIGTVDASGNVVDSKGQTIGTKVKAQVAIGADGKPIGTVVGDKVYDSNGNVVGRVVDGKVVSNDGRVLGSVSESTAVDANGNVLGNVVNGVVYDKDGKAIGKVDKNGNVVDNNGNVMGSTVGKVALDAQGKPIGKIVGDKVYDANGKLVATVDKDGNVIDLTGKKIGSASEGVKPTDVVLDANGKVIGRVVNGQVVDKMGNVIGTVDKNGNVVDLTGKPMGTVSKNVLLDAKGNVVTKNVVDKSGKTIGTIVGDKVLDENGNVIGTVNENGEIIDSNGNKMDVTVEADSKDAEAAIISPAGSMTVSDANPANLGAYESIVGGNKENGILKLDKTPVDNSQGNGE